MTSPFHPHEWSPVFPEGTDQMAATLSAWGPYYADDQQVWPKIPKAHRRLYQTRFRVYLLGVAARLCALSWLHPRASFNPLARVILADIPR